ncbi:hypothetical protein [Saccharolobus sp.]|uniref:hypothetical protein n=1 Tax=Saccharolobus sp. TaxID=2100761 RepID=UPI00316BF418
MEVINHAYPDTTLASYIIVLYNRNLELASKENLSYLYVDEVKLLKDFLDRREYDDILGYMGIYSCYK